MYSPFNSPYMSSGLFMMSEEILFFVLCRAYLFTFVDFHDAAEKNCRGEDCKKIVECPFAFIL